MTQEQTDRDYVNVPTASRPRTRLWRLLGWTTAGYCLLSLIASAFFLIILVDIARILPVEVNWSYVPLYARPSVLLYLTFPIWLPLSVIPLTALASVGCFRRAAGRGGRALLWFYCAASAFVCAAHVGAKLHMKYLGKVRIGLGVSIEVDWGDVWFAVVAETILLLPVLAAATALCRTRRR